MTAEILDFRRSKQTAPNLVLRKDFKKPKNADVRTREHLTETEVEALIKAARNVGRHGHRDAPH